MNEETKQEIQVILELLKKCLIKNHVSMGLEFRQKEIIFFDTDTYLKTGKLSGFTVKTDDLVK